MWMLTCNGQLVTAGVVSTSAVYLMAACSQELLVLCGRYLTVHRRCSRHSDEEAAFPRKNTPSTGRILGVCCAKLAVSTSDVSTAASIRDIGPQSDREDLHGATEGPAPRDEPEMSSTTGAASWVLDNPLLVSSWLFTLIICIPLRYSAGFEDPLGISLLLAIWTTTQTLQSSIKTSSRLLLLRLIQPKLRTALSVACNPVLWTAIGLIAYAAAESRRSSRPIEAVLSTLERNTTFTDLVMRRGHSSSSSGGEYIDFRVVVSSRAASSSSSSSSTDYAHSGPITPAVAAGDVANAILSAGLVCWGLKLWEYRRRLLSGAGFTILLVSCAAALANVVLGPLLAKGVLGPRSQAEYDLAFVARTVTLALGAPAVAKIGGDVGLNAAMVVVNGIMCQMLLGLGVGEWLGRLIQRVEVKLGGLRHRTTLRWTVIRGKGAVSSTAERPAESGSGTQGNAVTSNGAIPAATLGPIDAPSAEDGWEDTNPSTASKSTTTIASGITVGINAAAMGTAHLYEAGSDAAPYSALAMTVFGVATVGFTMIPQLGGWVVARVQ
jgi:putative effector of murein hydrolase